MDANKTVFDLTLYLWEEPTRTAALIEYSTDLFERATIERIAAHYIRLLTAATQDLACPVSALPLLSAAERATILATWNHPTIDRAAGHCLPELFAAEVARAPATVAVALESEQVTYGELDRRANQLAHYLLERGLVPETPVASCLERSLDMIVAFLGILKAGGVYLPLDPGYPVSRLLFMLEDSAAPILLTHARHVDQLAGYSGQVVCLDSAAATIAACSADPPAPKILPSGAAYLIYTSGSTGRPKGVLIEHRNAVNFAFAQQAHRRCYARGARPADGVAEL